MFRRIGTHLCILCLLLVALGTARPSVLYVSHDATGGGTGDSWADAFTSIQAGVNAAGAAGGGEVWVKSGTYSGSTSPPSTDSFEALDPDAVDIIGEERTAYYTSSGLPQVCHLTVLHLTGDVFGSTPAAQFGSTTANDSFAARLSGMVGGGDEVMVFANHPSHVLGWISREDLTSATNAGALNGVELKNDTDVGKWDYVLAHLDDQAGDCSNILWGLRADDQHNIGNLDYRTCGAMMGCIPTTDQDAVYVDRRLAFKDMVNRGSFVSLPANSKCGIPSYTFESSEGSASRMQISVYMNNIGGATSALIKFYGCEYATGNTPGTLLFSAPLVLNADNTASYCLTTTGRSDGQPLTVQQKANIKYIRPVITWLGPVNGNAYLQPVRIRSNGNWWNGPAHTLAGAQGVIGPSPYPVGGTDTGETVYFNTHCHTTASDGDASAFAMRAAYWENYGGLDPTKPRFTILTDHGARTHFTPLVASQTQFKQGVQLYGGFAGTETTRDQRNWVANPTTIDGQGTVRCVLMNGALWTNRSSVIIDGFTLRNGSVPNDAGGGMLVYDCSPTIRNCTFTGNAAVGGGGLSISSGARPVISDCSFTGNRGSGSTCGGGGIYILDSLLTITDCSFDGNEAVSGAGICCVSAQLLMTDCLLTGNMSRSSGGGLLVMGSYSVLSGCAFRGNSCPGDGGAIRSTTTNGTMMDCEFTLNSAGQSTGRGGGIYYEGSAVYLQDCRFTGNSAHDAGGVYSDSTESSIQNCIFAENKAAVDTGRGGAMFLRNQTGGLIAHNTIAGNSASRGGSLFCIDSPTRVANNVMAFNSQGICVEGTLPTLLHNDLYSNTLDYDGIGPGDGDISGDPKFADRTAGDYHLTAGSGCIDTGTGSLPGVSTRDMDGVQRPLGAEVDIGAYEYRSPYGAPKSIADGKTIVMGAAVVTAAFGGFFYIEADNRRFGIRVCREDYGLEIGMRADVTGTMRTNSDGERYIEADYVAANGVGIVDPIGMATRAIGGTPWLSADTGIVGQVGVTGGTGLNNVGLLIRTWGAVTAIGSGYLYLDDGSANTGLRVVCDPTGYGLGDWLEVTGISSCFATAEGAIARRILTRKPGDIRPLQ